MGTGHSLSAPSDRGKEVAFPPELEYLATSARMRDTVGIWDVLETLWRRRWLIAAVVISVMAAAVLVLLQIQPTYRAQALLIIESRSPNIASMVNVAFGQPADPESIQSEMVILRSPSLAKKVIDRLDLDQRPEFNPALRPSGWGWIGVAKAQSRKPASRMSEDILIPLGPTQPRLSGAAALPSAMRPNSEQASVINAFLEKLDVSVQGNSRVISVVFSSHDPQIAAQVPNTLVEIYLQDQREAKREIAELDTALLAKQVSALRGKVEAEDQAVEAYRKKSGLLLSEQGSPLINQQLSDTSEELAAARAERWRAEARLEQVKELARRPGGIDSSSELMDSALIPFLREQEVELQRKRAEMSVRYGPQHPAMTGLGRDIGELRARLAAEKQRILDGYRTDLVAARRKEAQLQAHFDTLKVEVAQANEKEIKLRSLEREAEADRALLATMLARLKETRQKRSIDAQQADARIVSLADIPSSAAFPKTGAMLALSLVGSTLLSMLIVLVSEQRDRGFTSRREAEEVLGIPVLGSVPKLSVFRKYGRRSIAHPLLDQSHFMLKEAMRSIYESILLSHRGGSPKSLLIASSVADEGKTAVAVGLARMEALTGSNVLVVDADLRRPEIHRVFRAAESPGLVELVAGEVELDAALNQDELSGTWYMTAGRHAIDPLDILTSSAFDDVLERLIQRFDLVVIDSPPSTMFLDARILSNKVEKTLFVVRCGETPQEVALDTLRRHAQSGAQISGVVLSMTDGKAEPRYG